MGREPVVGPADAYLDAVCPPLGLLLAISMTFVTFGFRNQALQLPTSSQIKDRKGEQFILMLRRVVVRISRLIRPEGFSVKPNKGSPRQGLLWAI